MAGLGWGEHEEGRGEGALRGSLTGCESTGVGDGHRTQEMSKREGQSP